MIPKVQARYIFIFDEKLQILSGRPNPVLGTAQNVPKIIFVKNIVILFGEFSSEPDRRTTQDIMSEPTGPSNKKIRRRNFAERLS